MIVGLPVGAVLIGAFLAFGVRSMFPAGWLFALGFTIGTLLSAAMPFGLSVAAANETQGTSAALLPLLGIVSGFVGAIAFIVTMVLLGSEDEVGEGGADGHLPTMYRKVRANRERDR